MNTKECVKDWINMSVEDDEKMFNLDEFDMKLTSTK